MSDTSNPEIATLLERYGRLLEIGGESAFRSRAFIRAAEAIRHYPGPVAALARNGTLQQIEGIGAGIAGVIEEYVRTGNVADLRTLQKRVPLSLLELIEVPGLGAKSVIRLHTQLGISDLAELEAAVQAGQVRSLPGFSVKSEAKILEGIESLRRRSGRHRLGSVLPLGRRIVDDLQRELPDALVSLAGSVRRMDETVADLDLVIGWANRAETIAAIERLSSVATLEREESDLASFLLHDGLRLDVVIVEPSRFGSALVRTTGNTAHLAQLGSVPDAASEEEVYASKHLPFISPELREGLFEFDLARNGQLDTLITVADIRGEFHCHTLWSDGALSVFDTARAAVEHGYEFLGISDHTRSLGVANGLDVTRLAAQRKEIIEANVELPLRLFASAEVEVSRDGQLDFDDPTLADLDIVIASTHVGLRQPREELTERLRRVLENRNVDIIAHPSGRLIEQREGGDFDWERVFETAVRTSTALEINADPARMDLSAVNARQAISAGCLITINCDAHHPTGWNLLEYGIANARKAGVRKEHVLNTWSVDRIEAWLKDRTSS